MQERANWLKRGYRDPSQSPLVPAQLIASEREFAVQVRLKGDAIDHATMYPPSLRVEMPATGELFGLRRFSVQHPLTRNYLHEWLLQALAARLDLLALKYRFAYLHFNGQGPYLMAIEEVPTAHTLLSQGRPLGPVLKFDESNYWQKQLPYREYIRTAKIESLDLKLDSAAISSALKQEAHNTLQAFRQGERTVAATFNVPAVAKTLALCDLLGAHHLFFTRNQRWYYHPVTKKFEPILLDANTLWTAGTTSVGLHESYPFNGLFFADPDFLNTYQATVVDLLTNHFVEKSLNSLRWPLNVYLRALKQAYPHQPVFSKAVLLRNLAYLANRFGLAAKADPARLNYVYKLAPYTFNHPHLSGNQFLLASPTAQAAAERLAATHPIAFQTLYLKTTSSALVTQALQQSYRLPTNFLHNHSAVPIEQMYYRQDSQLSMWFTWQNSLFVMHHNLPLKSFAAALEHWVYQDARRWFYNRSDIKNLFLIAARAPKIELVTTPDRGIYVLRTDWQSSSGRLAYLEKDPQTNVHTVYLDTTKAMLLTALNPFGPPKFAVVPLATGNLVNLQIYSPAGRALGPAPAPARTD